MLHPDLHQALLMHEHIGVVGTGVELLVEKVKAPASVTERYFPQAMRIRMPTHTILFSFAW